MFYLNYLHEDKLNYIDHDQEMIIHKLFINMFILWFLGVSAD